MAENPTSQGGDSIQSYQQRPPLQDRQEFLDPSQPVTDVPVTPWILSSDSAGDGDTSDSYFTPSNRKLLQTVAGTPSDAASGAKSTRDILHRMTSGLQRSDSLLDTDPRAANPSLGLSGGLISATFALPHSPQFRKGADWALVPRRGTSALFDSFTHLSSDKTPWNHTLVGWTGEIFPANNLTPPDTPSAANAASNIHPLNKDSAPIPIDAFAKPAESPRSEGLWICKEDKERLEWQLAHQTSSKTIPVWLSDDSSDHTTDSSICLKDQSRWRRFAETELYTLFHYKQYEPTNGHAERKSWADYYRMNQKFADRIMEIYKPGDIVMIHDYHLLLLPSMLRQQVPHMYISFFLHIPFPSSEFLLCLPRRKDILEGVLGANLIGFQSYSYLRHFVSCCTRILNFPSDTAGVDAYGTKVSVGVFPIGIDAQLIEELAFGDPVIGGQVATLRKLYEGKKIIVGRDRLDSVRGVAQKMMAFERFLERYPKWREKVVLIQVTSPTSIEEKKEDSKTKIANQISELIAKINGTYGSLGFSPIQHYPQYLSKEEYFALLRAADIGLITSVRDGMNTTSLEYVVCQRDDHGPLILSEFSGTAGSLKNAIHINPWDLSDVADQIDRALTMSGDMKSALHQSLYHHITTRNVQTWVRGFIKRLLIVLSARTAITATPLLDKAGLIQQYRSASKRLFMFDYDGTLTPIVKEPAAAIPSEKLIRTLKALASDHRNAVWIISGRDQEFLSTYLGQIPELGFSAEHGSFMRHPQQKEWVNLAERFDMSWQKEVMEVFQHYTEITRGSFIERKRCSLTWHYRQADPELGAHNSRECQKHLDKTVGKKWDIEVMAGKANLEVRPTFINKGEIAKHLVASYGEVVGELPELTLCLGDDFTDEDMFRALNRCHLPMEHVFTVTVGASSKMTLAKYHLLEPADVINTIALLNGGDTNIADMGPLGVVEGKIPKEMPGGEKIAEQKP